MMAALAMPQSGGGEVLPFPGPSPLPLRRVGSRLTAGEKSWQMIGVYGWEPSVREGREYFRVETAEGDELLVFRYAGERGMRTLFLAAARELPRDCVLG